VTHVVLVTGTGGAGRTTAAAATALAAARAGRRVLLLGAEHPGDAELVLGTGAARSSLTLEQVRGRAAFEADVLAAQGRLAAPAGPAAPLEPCEIPVLPGAAEVAWLRALAAAVRHGAHDVVVADLPEAERAATGLALPATLRRVLDRAPALPLLAAPRLHPLLAALTGLPLPRPGVLDTARRAGEELDRLRAAVDGPGTRVVFVQRPGAVAARAARRGLAALALHGHVPDAVVVNGGPGDPVHPAAVTATVPAFAAEPLGPAPLAAWAAAARTPAVLDAPRAGGAGPAVLRDGDRFVLALPLPGADRADLDLVRHGDDLVLTVGEHRRALALPSALRRCAVTGAALRDGELRVRFTPDPDVWMRSRP
jgi:arsenite-transporting ATPase